MKKVGEFNKVSIYADPACPSGKAYFFNENYLEFFEPKPTLWQRLKRWLSTPWKII